VGKCLGRSSLSGLSTVGPKEYPKPGGAGQVCFQAAGLHNLGPRQFGTLAEAYISEAILHRDCQQCGLP